MIYYELFNAIRSLHQKEQLVSFPAWFVNEAVEITEPDESIAGHVFAYMSTRSLIEFTRVHRSPDWLKRVINAGDKGYYIYAGTAEPTLHEISLISEELGQKTEIVIHLGDDTEIPEYTGDIKLSELYWLVREAGGTLEVNFRDQEE